MVRMQAQFTEAQARALRELAATRGVSIAALVREGVELLLAGRREPSWEERVRRAKEAAGMFASSGGDVAVRHDDYLDEIYGDCER
jgi:hypothetical protein